MRFTIYQESRVGGRRNNQDRIAYCYSRDALLMVVADGMGGHLHGEIAAELTTRFVTDAFQQEARPALADPSRFLSRTLLNAHHTILDYALDQTLAEAPRTTVVACVIQDGVAYWAHAGDSRLYLLRGGRIAAHTRDHSRVQLMVEHGLLSEDEAAHHPARNRIYSCLGGNQKPQIDLSPSMPLRDGDILALCTDGLWGPLGDDGVLLGLAGAEVMQAVPRLLERAEVLAGADADNLSLIALRWHDERRPAAETEVHSVSTDTMAHDDFTTRLETAQLGRTAGAADISDDEIERTIAELNAAIRRFSQ